MLNKINLQKGFRNSGHRLSWRILKLQVTWSIQQVPIAFLLLVWAPTEMLKQSCNPPTGRWLIGFCSFLLSCRPWIWLWVPSLQLNFFLTFPCSLTGTIGQITLFVCFHLLGPDHQTRISLKTVFKFKRRLEQEVLCAWQPRGFMLLQN